MPNPRFSGDAATTDGASSASRSSDATAASRQRGAIASDCAPLVPLGQWPPVVGGVEVVGGVAVDAVAVDAPKNSSCLQSKGSGTSSSSPFSLQPSLAETLPTGRRQELTGDEVEEGALLAQPLVAETLS